MDLAGTFASRFFISLERRADRRTRFTQRLAETGLSAEWLKAVPADRLGEETRGFANPRKRACSLSKRLALRAGAKSQADAVLVFEDDAVFHPEFSTRAAALHLPEDWGIFYFGCLHCERPEPVRPGLVRVRRAFDAQAFAVRRQYLPMVRARMRGGPHGTRGDSSSDVLLSDLHPHIPTYAAFPNLVWQEFGWSDVARGHYSNYEPDGRQNLWREAVEGLGG